MRQRCRAVVLVVISLLLTAALIYLGLAVLAATAPEFEPGPHSSSGNSRMISAGIRSSSGTAVSTSALGLPRVARLQIAAPMIEAHLHVPSQMRSGFAYRGVAAFQRSTYAAILSAAESGSMRTRLV